MVTPVEDGRSQGPGLGPPTAAVVDDGAGQVLEEMNDRLSARELQLVLVYFSQEERDSWRALVVFEWLRKENKVDKETMELMVALMCGWVRKLIEGEHGVKDVADLLVDMDCVGLKPGSSMLEKVVSMYWEAEKKDEAVSFVKEVLRKGAAFPEGIDGEEQGLGRLVKFEEVIRESEARGVELPRDMLEAARSTGLRKVLLERYLDLQGAVWPNGFAMRSCSTASEPNAGGSLISVQSRWTSAL